MKCHRKHTVWLTVVVEDSVHEFFIQQVLAPEFMGLMLFISSKKKKLYWNQVFLDKPESLIVFLVMKGDNLWPVFQCENNLF